MLFLVLGKKNCYPNLVLLKLCSKCLVGRGFPHDCFTFHARRWCIFKLLAKFYQELLKCSWTVKSERKLQSCLKLRKSQNPFCHILEILNKNYENKNCNDMFIQFRFIVSQSL